MAGKTNRYIVGGCATGHDRDRANRSGVSKSANRLGKLRQQAETQRNTNHHGSGREIGSDAFYMFISSTCN